MLSILIVNRKEFITIVTFILLFCLSCKKEINTKQQINEESPSTVASSDYGHLQQTKNYSSEVVLKWMNLQWRVFPASSEQDPIRDFLPPRFYAYCGIALYESVLPGMPAYQTLSGQLTDMPDLPDAHTGIPYHWPTCANAALASMTRNFLPNVSAAKKASIDSLEHALNTVYETEVNVSTFQRSVDFGKTIAQLIYNWSVTDGFFETYPTYVPPVGPGLWEPTPPAFIPFGPAAYYQHLRIFTPNLAGANALPLPIPYSTDQSSAFFSSMKEVYDTSLTLTTAQRTQANYWRGTPEGGPPVYCYFILRKILLESENTAMLDQAAFAYCKMGIVLSDAAISAFKENYLHNQVRPITYIRNVMGYDSWSSLFPTNPYPAYPEFHSTIYSACAAVLISLFGDNYQFNTNGIHHLGLPGYNFNSFDDAATHAAISRFYAGVNSMPFIEAGSWLGNKTEEIINTEIQFLKE